MDETFYSAIYHLVDDYIDMNINEYIKPTFYKNMISSITELKSIRMLGSSGTGVIWTLPFSPI